MSAAILAAAAAALAAVIHAVIARRLAGPALLLSIPLFGLVAAVALGLGAAAVGVELTTLELLLVVVAAASLSVAYMFAFVGVVYDSPTLALVNAILDHGPGGMPESALAGFVARHPFAATRLASLLAAGVLAEDGEGRLRVARVDLVMRAGAAYRRLCGLQDATG